MPDMFFEMMIVTINMLSLRMHLGSFAISNATELSSQAWQKTSMLEQKISNLNSLHSFFAKSIKGITSLSADDKAIYSASVVLKATCDYSLEAHRVRQLA